MPNYPSRERERKEREPKRWFLSRLITEAEWRMISNYIRLHHYTLVCSYSGLKLECLKPKGFYWSAWQWQRMRSPGTDTKILAGTNLWNQQKKNTQRRRRIRSKTQIKPGVVGVGFNTTQYDETTASQYRKEIQPILKEAPNNSTINRKLIAAAECVFKISKGSQPIPKLKEGNALR